MAYSERHPGQIPPDAEFQKTLTHLEVKYGVPAATLQVVLGHGISFNPATPIPVGQRTRQDLATVLENWARTLPKAI